MRTRRRSDRERGSVMVEAAVITPFLFMLIFGALELGLTYRGSFGLENASRSAARVASALPRDGTYNSDAVDAAEANLAGLARQEVQYLSIYKADPNTGAPVDGDFETCTTCYRYTYNQGTNQFDPVAGPSWASSSQSACGGTSDTDYVGVYLRSDHNYLTGIIGDSVTLTSKTVMRLEPISAGAGACSP